MGGQIEITTLRESPKPHMTYNALLGTGVYHNTVLNNSPTSNLFIALL